MELTNVIENISNDFDNKSKTSTKTISGINTNKCNKAIYTCITGKYDTIIQHEYISSDWDYICFTDNNELLKHKNIGIWQIRMAKKKNFNKTKNARWHKTHPHVLLPEYEESIWVDANVNIKTSKLFDILNDKSKNAVLLLPAHYKRNCIYQECDAVIDSQNDTVSNVNKARKFLIKQGMPSNFGMNETNIIYRKHKNIKVINLMEQWYKCINKYSKRDQLSWTYVLWKNNIDINKITIPNARIDKDNYDIVNHKNKKLCTKKTKITWASFFKNIITVKKENMRIIITVLGIKFKFKNKEHIVRN